MFRSSNPTLSAKQFDGMSRAGSGQAMTIQGAVNKSFILLGLLVLSASWVWGKIMPSINQAQMFGEAAQGAAASGMAQAQGWMFGGLIVGLVFALVTIFKKEWSPVTAPLYALAEGLVIGGVSAIFELQYPGIVIQASMLTFGVLFSLLFFYKTGMIKASPAFQRGLFAATGAICLIYLVSFVMSFFGASIPLIHGSGPFGIGFSLVVVVIAALNLVMDFHLIEQGSKMGMPKYMEWYSAFALMVTLVWLYMEILRLLSKLNRR